MTRKQIYSDNFKKNTSSISYATWDSIDILYDKFPTATETFFESRFCLSAGIHLFFKCYFGYKNGLIFKKLVLMQRDISMFTLNNSIVVFNSGIDLICTKFIKISNMQLYYKQYMTTRNSVMIRKFAMGGVFLSSGLILRSFSLPVMMNAKSAPLFKLPEHTLPGELCIYLYIYIYISIYYTYI